jgi:TonB family protein
VGSENYTPDGLGHFEDVGSDRRSHARLPLPSLAYVELGQGNGGIILNLGEGGLAVQAAMTLVDDELPSVRFQLGPSKDWIETGARIAWKGGNRKLAGLQFLELRSEVRDRIRGWIAGESAPAEAVRDAPLEGSQNSSHDNEPIVAEDEPEKEFQPPRSQASQSDVREPERDQDAAQDEERFTWSPETGFVRIAPNSLTRTPVLPINDAPAPPKSPAEIVDTPEEEQKFVWSPDAGFVRTAHNQAPETAEGPADAADGPDSKSVAFSDQNGSNQQQATEFRPHELYWSQMHVVEKSESGLDVGYPETPRLSDGDALDQRFDDLLQRAAQPNFAGKANATGAHETATQNGAPEIRRQVTKAREFPFKPIAAPQLKRRRHRGLQGALARALPFVVLALPAIAIGWMLGRSPMGRSASTDKSGTQWQATGQETAAAQATIRAQVPDLEIVDENRRAWTIPFAGPSDQPRRDTEVPTSGPSATESRRMLERVPRNPSPSEITRGNGVTDAFPDQRPDAGASDITDSISSPSAAVSGPPAPPTKTTGVQRGILIYRVEPVYPAEAEQQGLQGAVKLRVAVAPDGAVRFVQLISGPGGLAQAAIDAVQQWRFSPTLLNGKAVEATGNVTISFHLTSPHNTRDSNQ